MNLLGEPRWAMYTVIHNDISWQISWDSTNYMTWVLHSALIIWQWWDDDNLTAYKFSTVVRPSSLQRQARAMEGADFSFEIERNDPKFLDVMPLVVLAFFFFLPFLGSAGCFISSKTKQSGFVHVSSRLEVNWWWLTSSFTWGQGVDWAFKLDLLEKSNHH